MLSNTFLTLYNEIRDNLISLIYQEQNLEWQAILTSADITTISKSIEYVQKEYYKLLLSDRTIEVLKRIIEDDQFHDIRVQKEAELIYEKAMKQKAVSQDSEIIKLKIECKRKYCEAKKNNDFNIVKPSFEKMIKNMFTDNSSNRYRTILHQRLGELSYNEIETFFDTLKSNMQIEEPTIIKKYILKSNHGIENVISYLLDLMEIDRSAIEIRQDIDSYMISFGTKNVKLALNYNEEDLFSLIKIITHEMGHVLYEQRNDNLNNNTFLSGAASTTFSEGMAYLFEHNIGENSLIQQQIINNCNLLFTESEVISNTPYRIKSNAKLYPTHILIRYELEKGFINGDLNIDELNQQWKQEYKSLLGIKIIDDNHGILQDPHWFNAQFGYFPCYLIGRAYASQVLNSLNKSIDFESYIKKQDLKCPIEWLEKNVYHYGASKKPKDILLKSTGESFNPRYYYSNLGFTK